jgi:uncharacterized SAM-binding protein YcdF (DUF218 family)
MSSDKDLTGKKTAAIVLGGGLDEVKVRKNATGRVSSRLPGKMWELLPGQTEYEPKEQVKGRLDKAYELLDAGQVDYIVTTGRYSKRVGINLQVTGPKTEAEVGKKYLLERFGVGEERILYENQSFDTIGNAWFAKKVCLEPFDITACTIITSDYHVERSEIVFKWVLGPRYEVECVAVESQLSARERKQRGQLEQIAIGFVKTHLLASIPPGDDEAIGRFMEHEHLRYCLSERSEAMFEVFVETAAIKAGY